VKIWDWIKSGFGRSASGWREGARGDSYWLKSLFEKQRVGLHGLDPFPRFDKHKLFVWSRESDLAFACVQKIIEAAQDPDLIVERRLSPQKPWQPEAGHPLRRLMMRPNPEMTQAEFLGAWLASEEVCGEFFAEIERDNRGLPVALWPLDPACILPAHVVYPESRMDGWIWRDYGQEVHLKPRDVFYSLRRDPQCPWLPLAPLRVALGSVEADAMQTAFVRAFFKNSGVPSGIIKIKGRSLKDEEAEGMRQRWMRRYGSGARYHGGPAVFDENADYEKIGADLSEIEGGALRAQNEARICGVFGVPPLLVSAYVGLMYINQRASAEQAQKEFWANKMSPVFKRMRLRLTWSLLLEFEQEEAIRTDSVRLNWDMSQEIALQESMSERSMRAREDFRVGGLTLNEFRAVLGMTPLADGDYYLRRVNVIPVTPDVIAAQSSAAAAAAASSVALILSGSRSGVEDDLDDGKILPSRVARKVYNWDGLEVGREPTEFERKINVKALGELMNSREQSGLSVLMPARDALISEAVSKLSTLDVADFHTLTLSFPQGARDDLRGVLDAAYSDGRDGFLSELRAQGAPEARGFLTPDSRGSLDLIADAAISRLVNDVQSRASSAGLHFAPLVSSLELPGRVDEQLRQMSNAGSERIAAEASNAAIALGRQDESRGWRSAYYIYSAILDKNTCALCRSLDGFTTTSFELMPTLPNPDCGTGWGRCRCAIMVAIG
jgi:HK97 family phage portal protein